MACWAKMVSMVVTPSMTRSVMASGSIQKEIHETMTMRKVGKYVCKTARPMRRRSLNSTWTQEKEEPGRKRTGRSVEKKYF